MSEQTGSPIRVQVSAGELLDKISILLIKQERILDPRKLVYVQRELTVLAAARDHALRPDAALQRLAKELKTVNESLWDIEDEIRACEYRSQFDQQFISLARNVYQINDRRAEIKLQINQLTNSEFAEVKAYADYADG